MGIEPNFAQLNFGFSLGYSLIVGGMFLNASKQFVSYLHQFESKFMINKKAL